MPKAGLGAGMPNLGARLCEQHLADVGVEELSGWVVHSAEGTEALHLAGVELLHPRRRRRAWRQLSPVCTGAEGLQCSLQGRQRTQDVCQPSRVPVEAHVDAERVHWMGTEPSPISLDLAELHGVHEAFLPFSLVPPWGGEGPLPDGCPHSADGSLRTLERHEELCLEVDDRHGRLLSVVKSHSKIIMPRPLASGVECHWVVRVGAVTIYSPLEKRSIPQHLWPCVDRHGHSWVPMRSEVAKCQPTLASPMTVAES
mmetsp:Transcript_116802/g.342002  ORF Transcript_116802/g.342002 Transcript_116802/m.342002 type:complete len:256 (-) Transcript_116802:802-1569(-)